MSLVYPLALVGFLLVIAAAVLTSHSAFAVVRGLPGTWVRIVDASLRRYLAAGAAGQQGRQVALCLIIASLIIFAMARPVLDRTANVGFANLAGRVLVIDEASGHDVRRLRLVAGNLVAAAPDIPTALVAVAAEAYTVVPLTTDGRQIDRYLQVLGPDVMPEPGRALHRGLAHAEALLTGAGSVVRQIVLITGDAAPTDTVSIAGSETMRVVALANGSPEDWRSFTDVHAARLVEESEFAETVEALRREIVRTLRAETPSATLELTPFVIGLAMVLWLGLFRRRAEP